jgi:1,4-dihydroxy-2-naphthoate octaprenyltransferase
MNLKTLIKLSNPIQYLFSGLLYFLGAGIPRYLGHKLNFIAFILGLVIIWSLQLSSSLLVEYFRLPLMPLMQNETPRLRERFRVALFQASFASLTLAAALIVSLFVLGFISIPAGLAITIIIIALVFYAIPPFRLSETGYGEIIMAGLFGFLFPAFAYLIQNSGIHRLLTYVAIPLMFLALDYFLVRDFSTFAADIKLDRNTLLTRLSWQKAIPIHHILLLAAYFLFAVSPFLGIPWGLVWPVVLSYPFGIIQGIWLQRISLGGPTHWKFITGLSAATLSLAIYLLALSLWLR